MAAAPYCSTPPASSKPPYKLDAPQRGPQLSGHVFYTIAQYQAQGKEALAAQALHQGALLQSVEQPGGRSAEPPQTSVG